MIGFRLAVGFAIVVGFTGCGSDQDTAATPVMPDVMGLQLDVALSDIERAGFEDEVEVLSDGVFGVVDESNWQVCEQLPAAGEAVTTAPRLTVDRSCEGDAPEPTTPPTDPEPTTPPTAPEPAASDPPSEEPIPEPEESVSGEAEEILTVENSEDLAALLAGPTECDESIADFAAKYQDRIIEFDGNIAVMSNYDQIEAPFFERWAIDDGARYDIGIYVGDFSETALVGPSFRFTDVAAADLNFTGSNVPDSIGAGDSLHIVATVGEFTNGCLLLLDPVSTEVR